MKQSLILIATVLFTVILSAQNVGIGIANPTEKLHVNGNIRVTNDADIFGLDQIVGFNDLRMYGSPTSSTLGDLFISSTGDVEVRTGKLRLTAFANDEMVIINNSIWNHGLGNQNFGLNAGGDYFLMASKEGSFDGSGIYGDGNYLTFWSPGDAAQGQPGAYAYFLEEDSFDGSVDDDPFNNNALKIYLNGSGMWQVSDQRKKQNIQPLDQALDKVLKLGGYTYDFMPNEEEIAKGDQPLPAAGIMAQELKEVLPQAVNENDQGAYFVNYSAIVPLLIEAIKEQAANMETLEKENADLKARMDKLEALIE